MTVLSDAFKALTDLRLWFKTRTGDSLTLADVPTIIPLRYDFFRKNWEPIKQTLFDKIEFAADPNRLRVDIDSMSNLIEVQRSSLNQKVNPFDSSTILVDYFAIFDNMLIDELPITKEEQSLIVDEEARVRAFIKQDFKNIKSSIILARDDIADEVGGTDPDYNATYDRSPIPALRNIRIKDIQNMSQLQAGIKGVDFVLANANALLSTVSIDPFLLARQNANNPSLQIEQGKSARLVRLNFGEDLQSLAYRYLGDEDRWPEIAIANGLKAPYIDEIGQAVSLLSNGSGNQLNISKTDGNSNANIDKFYIGQAVFLTSTSVKFPEQRSIVNIREIPVSGEIVLELNGDDDLDKYKISENARVRVYLPNTVNSNFLVSIPTPVPPGTAPGGGGTPYFLSGKSEDEKRAGVDLSVNSSFDLVFTPTSDIQLSFGVPNAVQAVKIKLVSEKGQNKRHQEFGVASIMGEKLDTPTETKQALITSITDMIEADNRFDRVENLGLSQVDTAFLVNLEVRMAGTGTVVPISFTVNTG